MKRIFRYIAATALACGALSCTEFEEFNNDTYIPAPGEKIKLTLNATRGGSDVDPDTRVYVGQIVGNKVRYYWNEGDQIGVIPLTITDAKPNYVTSETAINAGDKNLAQFEAYIEAEGYDTSQQHLLIYYPYNSSMLEGTTGNTGREYASKGLTFRLPQEQEQYGYGKTFVGENVDQSKEHPSVWAISRYGLAYDLAGTAFSSETEGSQVIANATGEFQLDHANTYFQFNVFGTQSSVSGKDYGDGTWKLSSVTLEAGHCELTTDDEGNTIYSLSDQIALAGTYKFSYEYNSGDFANVGGVNNNSAIKLNTVAGLNSVRVNMNNVESAPAIGGTTATSVPAFVVLNGMQIKSNPKGNLNALKVSVTCFKYDESGNVVGSDTRVRYYNIGDIVGKDLSGNYYTIDFEVCDPVESYTDLSVSNTANCYLIGAPGNYSFNANVAGNAKLPYGKAEGGTSMGINPANLLSKGKENYDIDWLWASGISFENADNGSMTDTEVVKQILNNVELSGETGHISIGLAAGSTMQNLSGNVLIALYEKNTDGTAGDIVWTWHIWLGQPGVQHYHFPATNRDWVYTNEDWYMMDRNLGAETAELGNPRSTGLFYQRSRKEPMIGFGNVTGSTTWTENQIPTYRNTEKFGSRAVWTAGMSYSNYNTLKYPMALMTGIPSQTSSSDYYYGWSSAKSDVNDVSNDTKSMFDPCPAGYRMPTVREWDNLKSDIYYWIGGVQGSGVFGYCQWENLPEIITNTNDERNIDYLARIAGGDYYTVNAQYERQYHIKHNSGTGSEIVTNFPNTGILRGKGEWGYIYQDAAAGASGPKISVGNLQGNNNGRYYIITLSGGSSYYYTINEVNPTSAKEVSYNTRYYVYRNNNNYENLSSYLPSNNSKVTIYFYTSRTAGAPYGQITITRKSQSEFSYVIGSGGSEATSALWTSGRIDDGAFYTYWFGPANDTGDGWSRKETNGQYGVNGGATPPFTESRETFGLSYTPVSIMTYLPTSTPEWNNDPALPVRCIREYDNTSTSTVNE